MALAARLMIFGLLRCTPRACLIAFPVMDFVCVPTLPNSHSCMHGCLAMSFEFVMMCLWLTSLTSEACLLLRGTLAAYVAFMKTLLCKMKSFRRLVSSNDIAALQETRSSPGAVAATWASRGVAGGRGVRTKGRKREGVIGVTTNTGATRSVFHRGFGG